MNGTIPINISRARNNFPKIIDQVFSKGSVYEIRKGNIPVAKIVPLQETISEEERERRFRASAGSWKMTDEEARKLIKETYQWRKDGSSKKKNLWEP